jgi:hypothetical protein
LQQLLVFGGKNSTLTFLSSKQTDSEWPGALSIINKTLNATVSVSHIFQLPGENNC